MGTRKSSKAKTKELDTKDFKDKPKVSKFVVHTHVKDDVYHATSREGK
jgi:hypothetical protein